MQKQDGLWSLHVSWNTKGWEDFFSNDVFLEQNSLMKFNINNVLPETSNENAIEAIHHELGITTSTESFSQIRTVAIAWYK